MCIAIMANVSEEMTWFRVEHNCPDENCDGSEVFYTLENRYKSASIPGQKTVNFILKSAENVANQTDRHKYVETAAEWKPSKN